MPYVKSGILLQEGGSRECSSCFATDIHVVIYPLETVLLKRSVYTPSEETVNCVSYYVCH